MDVNKRNELLEFLVELRDNKASLEEKLKLLNEEISGVEKEIIEDMVTQGDASFNHNGVTCSIRLTERISAEPGTKDELWAVMKRQKFDHLFTINPQTLSGTIKELKTNNGDKLPEWLEGLVKVYEQPGLTLKKGTDISKKLKTRS